MGKAVPHVSEDLGSGRLFYRRAFPQALRPYLEKPRRELKVPLGARGRLSLSAMRQWEIADRQFADEVQAARAGRSLQEKEDAGAFDVLFVERLQELTDTFVHAWHSGDEENLRTRGGDWADRALGGWHDHLDDMRRWRVEGDTAAMEAWWGKKADALLTTAGLRLRPENFQDRERLLWAINTAALELSVPAQARLKGHVIPIPPPPASSCPAAAQPSPPSTKSFETIVEGLLVSPRKPISATTQESARTALRLFREACGASKPDEITRALVADWLDMLAQRPAKLPPEHRATPLPELIALYEERPEVPRLSAKTLAQHLSALSARWAQAGRNGRLDQDMPNPFKGHDLDRPKRPKAPKGFSSAELTAIFSLPVFTQGARPRGGKGEASYWLPLILAFTGARPEEIAQLLVTDVFRGAEGGPWLLRISDEGGHPHKGRQRLKTVESRRTFPIPSPLIELGLLRYLERLKTTGEAALFPQLRTKGARGLLFAGFGDWWGKYLRESGVHLEGMGRQPARETRHTWSTAARASGIPREAMAYIQGHALADATAGEGYGDRNPLGAFIDRLRLEGLPLSAIRPWE